MIFVTVGTHEQSFNRLIEEVDCLKKENTITEDVFVQIGFSSYEPKYCRWKRIISYDEMNYFMKEASIIICHGGPATFMGAIANGKKPIVVPRQEEFREHVNNHQLEFAQLVEKRFHSIYTVTDIKKLEEILVRPQESFKIDSTNSNNKIFVENLTNEINFLFSGEDHGNKK